VHGNGLGAPSPEQVEARAREIAMIDERDPDEFTDADWEQARREETKQNADLVDEWEVTPTDTGHRVGGEEEEESLGELLVTDGVEEANHDQMLEARKEEIEQEGDII